MNPELENTQKIWENFHKTCSTQENHRQVSRERSVDSYISEQNCDTTLSSGNHLSSGVM